VRTLAERLFLTPGMAAAMINAPDGVAAELDVTRGLKVPGKGKVALDWLLVFVRDQDALRRYAGTIALAVKPDAVVWFAHPVDGDVTDGWEPLQTAGFQLLASETIGDAWTAVRFRPPPAPA
jgi:hypothetical protein